jgi:ABC-type amino acid transport substrate-binding protein
MIQLALILLMVLGVLTKVNIVQAGRLEDIAYAKKMRCGIVKDADPWSFSSGEKLLGYDVEFCGLLAQYLGLALKDIEFVQLEPDERTKPIWSRVDVLIAHVEIPHPIPRVPLVSIPYARVGSRYFGIVAPSGDQEFIHVVNLFLGQKIRDGTQSVLYNKYFQIPSPDLALPPSNGY